MNLSVCDCFSSTPQQKIREKIVETEEQSKRRKTGRMKNGKEYNYQIQLKGKTKQNKNKKIRTSVKKEKAYRRMYWEGKNKEDIINEEKVLKK